MENAVFNTKKDGQMKRDSVQCLSEDMKSTEDNSLSQKLVTKVKPEHVLISNVRKSQTIGHFREKLFLQSTCGLDYRIPKRIMSIDENYLRRCLELIHVSAMRAASSNISSNFCVLSDSLSSSNINCRSTCALSSFVIESPLEAGTENGAVSSSGDWILGTITGSNSMMNLLKSPYFGRTNLIDIKSPMCSDFKSSPGGLSIGSSQKLEKEMLILGDQKYGPEPVHKRLVSVSSTNSTCSDISSSSASAALSQGMLQCTWKDGLPHYVFSIDGQREVYFGNLFKVESSADKALDYMYMFYSTTGGKNERGIHESDSDFVGKMRVSTSFALCPNNIEIMETRFVLFGSNDNCVEEIQTSSHTIRKRKGLSKKMMDALRTSHSYRQRTSSKFRRESAILESCSWEPSHDSNNFCDPLGSINLSENHLPHNLELAAIIVKDHIRANPKETGMGGWGLKFLKKVGIRQNNSSIEVPVRREFCLGNTGDCSTAMNILLPAGFHGGPRTRNGGPASLIERWCSGGHCDCGGWDIGCPLTVLNAMPNKNEVSAQPDMLGKCTTFDLFIQGSKQGAAAIMNMVNIHDSLYYIHFQPTLSALQSFSIAASIIHSRSPTLRPKLYRS